MNIAIGTDHRGFMLKNEVQRSLLHTPDNKPINWIDVGCFSDVSCDYPIGAKHVVDVMRKGRQIWAFLCVEQVLVWL